jgi:hypothetical protein
MRRLAVEHAPTLLLWQGLRLLGTAMSQIDGLLNETPTLPARAYDLDADRDQALTPVHGLEVAILGLYSLANN